MMPVDTLPTGLSPILEIAPRNLRSQYQIASVTGQVITCSVIGAQDAYKLYYHMGFCGPLPHDLA